MGGQACILYGAAEFSRDIDLAIMVAPENLDHLRSVLQSCQATPAYVPALTEEALRKGHACHFRCQGPDLEGLRIDVMGRMRGVEAFPALWKRRMTFDLPEIGSVDVMGLQDLVLAKKTQRDKDWPMIRRLIEADMHRQGLNASRDRIRFWLRECRSPESLQTLSLMYPDEAKASAEQRPLLATVPSDPIETIAHNLRDEEEYERELDRAYWRPLKDELERLRHRQE